MTDPSLLSAQELAQAYRSRAFSPVDAIDALLARITRLNPKLHAFIDLYADDARLAAEGADRLLRAGHDLGPLHGIPFAIKDLIAVAGRPYAAGSKIHLGRPARETAQVVRKLVAAGAIMLGKVHTVEFAFGGWGTNPHLGTPRNPWAMDVHHTPGGSSSGSGVAVGARLAPLAIGTDTGGSVRIPASFNGVTGLKVTRGRISNHGIEPLSPTLDTPGPLARSVEDAAIMYRAMQGPDEADPMTFGILPEDPLPGLKRGIAALRLGRITEADSGNMWDAEVAAAYEAAIETLARLGATIVPISLPGPFSDYARLSHVVMAAEAYALHGSLAEDAARPMGPHVRARIMAGKVSAQDYLQLLWRLPAMQAEFLAAMAGVDALLTPTTRYPARPVEGVDEATAPSDFTRVVNLLGLCALALPDGFSAGGLPLSLQIIGRPFAEAEVLRIGWAYQQATDWHLRTPNL
ncbi:amidase [Acidisoma cellulosilytica]|uniref:Amidase n=1 Tax=Acidisoma cellulosilyticum TaxID=2802395 RepID=A0A963YZ32_9PROT|nr:amidase [Acidisoma cellulosilyticum]MCB8879793.1 amidase [Acidisoma cellulosilyticum]